MIFWRKSLVMLSIPKTGTHSYIDHLQGHADIVFRHPQNLKHMGLRKFTRRILPLLPESAAPTEYFAVMRDPIDWLWSWYCYRSRTQILNRSTSTNGVSFSDFIRGHLQDKPPAYADVGRQSLLLTSPDTPYIVDSIYSYTHLDAANAYLSDRLGVRVAPPDVLNKSPVQDKCISRADQSLLETAMPEEFELYGAAL